MKFRSYELQYLSTFPSETNILFRNPSRTKANLWGRKRKQTPATSPSKFTLRSDILCVFCNILLLINSFMVCDILLMTTVAAREEILFKECLFSLLQQDRISSA